MRFKSEMNLLLMNCNKNRLIVYRECLYRFQFSRLYCPLGLPTESVVQAHVILNNLSDGKL